MKKYLTKNLWWLKKTMKVLGTILNLGFVAMIMSRIMLTEETIVITLENIEALHIGVVILIWN